MGKQTQMEFSKTLLNEEYAREMVTGRKAYQRKDVGFKPKHDHFSLAKYFDIEVLSNTGGR